MDTIYRLTLELKLNIYLSSPKTDTYSVRVHCTVLKIVRIKLTRKRWMFTMSKKDELSVGKLETLIRGVAESIEPVTSENIGQATVMGAKVGYRYSSERLIELKEAVVRSKNFHYFEAASLGQDVLNTITKALEEFFEKKKKSGEKNFDQKNIHKMLIAKVFEMISADDEEFDCVIPVTGIVITEKCVIAPITFYPANSKEDVISELKQKNEINNSADPQFQSSFAVLKVKASNPQGAADWAANIVESMLNAFQTLWGQIDQPRGLYIGDFPSQRNSERIALTKGKGIFAYAADRSVFKVKLDKSVTENKYLKIIAKFESRLVAFEESKSTKLERDLFNANKLIAEGIASEKKDTKFTKLMSAVESLVEEKTMTQSITTQVSENVAFLIGRNADERIEIFNLMKKLYSRRSIFAHGESTFLSDMELNTLLTYIRRLVVAIVNDFEDLNSVGVQKRVKLIKFGKEVSE